MSKEHKATLRFAVLRLVLDFWQLWLLVVNPAYGFDINVDSKCVHVARGVGCAAGSWSTRDWQGVCACGRPGGSGAWMHDGLRGSRKRCTPGAAGAGAQWYAGAGEGIK